MPKINPAILTWARDTAGLTPTEAVAKLKIGDARGVPAVERLAAMEAGEVEPTRPMLAKMAKQYRRPLLTFYLSKPPRRGDRGEDFRTLPEEHSGPDEVLLDALIRNVRASQSLLRTAIEDEEEVEPLPFIGSASVSDGVAMVLGSITQTLALTLAAFYNARNADAAFDILRTHVEEAGVFVVLASNLGSHHSTISLDTFRGFALADDLAPFVIINDQDSRAAWSFTLLHELTHLWLGQTGVSGGAPEKAIERFCNDVASDFLLPSEELRRLQLPTRWSIDGAADAISNFARDRNVSRSMVAYKLYRNDAISLDRWRQLRNHFRQGWLTDRLLRRQRGADRSGGGDFYVTKRHRLGRALIDTTTRLMAAGAITTSKAARILGIKPQQIQPLVAGASPLNRAS